MSPAQVLCAVTVFALVQMVIGVHQTATHPWDSPVPESTASTIEIAALLEWLARGLRDEQAAGALEDPEVAALRAER